MKFGATREETTMEVGSKEDAMLLVISKTCCANFTMLFKTSSVMKSRRKAGASGHYSSGRKEALPDT